MHTDFGISDEDWDSTPQSVKTTLTALAHQLRLFRIRFSAYEKKLAGLEEKAAAVESLKTEVAILRERLGQNSSNSSLPPCSDAPQHRRPARREASGRKQGAQAGHRGRGRALKPAEEVDSVVDLRPERCARCGRRLRGDDAQPKRHQVTEIPPARAEVIEYRRHTLCYERCGAQTPAAWGEEVPEGSFGARLSATVAYLTGRLALSHRDSVEAVSALHGVEMSVGTVAAIQRQVSRARAAPVRTAQAFARRQAVNHVDETGWRECGARGWLWVNVTPQVTAFRVAARRDAATAREVIGEVRDRVVTTDWHLSYGWLSAQRRQVCWAHLKREFQAMAERTWRGQRDRRGVARRDERALPPVAGGERAKAVAA